MTVRHSIDPKENKVVREIRERSYRALSILKQIYEGKGHKTKLTHFKNDEWLLRVIL